MTSNITPGVLNFENFAGSLPNAVTNAETRIQGLMAEENPTSAQLIEMQLATQQWTLGVTTVTTVLKTLGDTLKETLRKIQ